jgi:hypothetical protein
MDPAPLKSQNRLPCLPAIALAEEEALSKGLPNQHGAPYPKKAEASGEGWTPFLAVAAFREGGLSEVTDLGYRSPSGAGFGDSTDLWHITCFNVQCSFFYNLAQPVRNVFL